MTKDQLDRYMATGDINPQPAQHLPDKLVYDGYESPQYIEGWNDCREFMKGMK